MGFIENGRQGEEETERRHAVVYNDHGNLVKALRTPWSPWSVVCGAAPQLIPTPLLQPRARQPEHLRRSRIFRRGEFRLFVELESAKRDRWEGRGPGGFKHADGRSRRPCRAPVCSFALFGSTLLGLGSLSNIAA